MIAQLSKSDHQLGRIHSCFTHSMNIEFANFLLNISDSELPLTPLSLRISANEMQKLLTTCSIDDLVNSKHNRLYIYTKDQTHIIAYDEFQVIKMRLIPVKNLNNFKLSNKAWCELKNLDYPKSTGLNCSDPQFNQSLIRLNESLLSELNIKKVLDYFIGRGPGLTPSGDDFLLGYFAVKIYLNKSCEKFLSTIKENYLERTTDISKAFWKALLDGYIAYDLLKLLQYLQEENAQQFCTILNRIKSYGHTSGMDILAGVYIALHEIFYPKIPDSYLNFHYFANSLSESIL